MVTLIFLMIFIAQEFKKIFEFCCQCCHKHSFHCKYTYFGLQVKLESELYFPHIKPQKKKKKNQT